MINLDKYIRYGFIVAVFAIIAMVYKACDDRQTFKEKELQEVNLRKALADTVHHFKTENGLIGAEKLTIQTELNTLKDSHQILTDNQKALIKEVERQNKNATTFAAALIQLKAEIKDWKDSKPVAETDSSVQFAKKTPNLEYDLLISNVKPLDFKMPTLTFNSLSFPNTQTINFHWKSDDKKEGYPVSFSVINSNPYFTVSNIESYTIPEIQKNKLKPTLWQKIGTFSKTTGGKVLFFGLGVGAGVLIAK